MDDNVLDLMSEKYEGSDVVFIDLVDGITRAVGDVMSGASLTIVQERIPLPERKNLAMQALETVIERVRNGE